MQTQNKLINASYTVTIEVAKTASEVFSHLVALDQWWLEDFVGEEIKLNSVFILKTGDGHFSKNKVLEFVPNKKLVWMTTESLRKADNYNWSGSKFIFELASRGNDTEVKFTYDGVVLENEYETLVKVCNLAIQEKLLDFITNGKAKT